MSVKRTICVRTCVSIGKERDRERERENERAKAGAFEARRTTVHAHPWGHLVKARCSRVE